MAYVENVPAGDHCAADRPNLPHPDGRNADDIPATSAHPPLPPDPTSPVIDGVEDDGVWRHYRAETLALLRPVGFAELELAEAIALLSWRLRRVGRLEADALADGFARQKEAAGSPPRGRIGACERVLAVICRYEGRLERAKDRAARELRALQQARRVDGPAVPGSPAAPPPSTPPTPMALGSIGKNAAPLADDRPSVSPDPSGLTDRHCSTADRSGSFPPLPRGGRGGPSRGEDCPKGGWGTARPPQPSLGKGGTDLPGPSPRSDGPSDPSGPPAPPENAPFIGPGAAPRQDGSFGQNNGATACGGEAPAITEDRKPMGGPGAAAPGAVASFRKTAGPRPGDTRPAPRSRSRKRASVGPTPAGAVGSLGQKAGAADAVALAREAARALSPRTGWVAPLVDVDGGTEEDEWTHSSYKSYWAERDAADRAARERGTTTGPMTAKTTDPTTAPSPGGVGSFGKTADSASEAWVPSPASSWDGRAGGDGL